MIDNQTKDIILKFLELKSHLSEIERDIVDSINDLFKIPVDKKTLENRVIINKAKYLWLEKEETKFNIISGTSTIVKSINKASIPELQDKLSKQIQLLFLQLDINNN